VAGAIAANLTMGNAWCDRRTRLIARFAVTGRFRAAQKQIISKTGMYFCWVSGTSPTAANALEECAPYVVRLPNPSDVSIRPLA